MAFPITKETEPIIGYRLWKLVESAEGMPVLYSVVQDYVWLPFEPAQPGPAQPSPDPGNYSGVYAHRDVDKIWEYYDPGERGRTVAGAVSLWGTVIEHDAGYRAEFAYPKELWMPDDADPALIMRLEETYGVPVTLKENFPAAPPPPPPMQFKPAGKLMAGVFEPVRDVVYDRQPLDSGRIHFFIFPLGATRNSRWTGAYTVDYAHTNMMQCGMLPAPNRFLVTGMRCVFFELDGRPVPISDPIYWETFLRFSVNRKAYWMSPPAHCADPAILFGATDWSKIPAAERLTLINKLVHKLTAGPVPIPMPGGDQMLAVDGVMIEQQMNFDAEINVMNPGDVTGMGNCRWYGRSVMLTLEGIALRSVL